MANGKLKFVAGGLALLAAASAVYAAGKSAAGKGNRYEQLLALDQDNDRAISAGEFVRPLELRFSERDKNKDGILETDELVSQGRSGRGSLASGERLMKRFDANGDGQLTAQEFSEGQTQAFKRRDKNGDGKITAEESPRRFRRGPAASGAETLEERLSSSSLRFKAIDANADGTVDAEEIKRADAERQAYSIKRTLHRLDANNDGRVTPEEYIMPSKRRFSQLDLDSDGRITADDLPPAVRSLWAPGQR